MRSLRTLTFATGLLAAAGVGLMLSSTASHASPLVPAASSKSTVKFAETMMVDGANQDGWTTLLSNGIKTSSQKDLFCDVSLECGLFTRTEVQSKGGKKDTSTAEGIIKIRVVVDGMVAYPGEVVFAGRSQTLSATLEGQIAKCLSVDADTGAIVLDEDCVQPEAVELILDTMTASSFNFIIPDCGVGEHTVDVQCLVETTAYAEDGVADVMCAVGKGCFTVQEVRLVKNEDMMYVE